MGYVELMKNFLLADSSKLMAIRLFSAPEPKNVGFLLSRHDVGQVHEKFSFRRLLQVQLLLDSFRPPEAKNV